MTIRAKIERGERLSLEDGVGLYGLEDIWELGSWAEQATLRRVGDAVYYSINRHINYTNICQNGCGFCGFSRKVGEEGGYTMSVGEVVDEAREAYQEGATEVHIVGGVHPELEWEYYGAMVAGVRAACPEVHIKAFTAVEIIAFAEKAQRSVEEVLVSLREAGLGSLPGGGAEILNEDYFRRVCPNKPGPEQWGKVHATAHGLGMRTNATMLFGHIESPAERIEHLIKLRAWQDESLKKGKGYFQCFVPLLYIRPQANEGESPDGVCEDEEASEALLELKTIAISRLMLDNFDHIKAFWPMLGEKVAQIALCFGANDLDGTVQQYRIVDRGKGNPTDSLTVEQIRALISETGRRYVQRDAFYQAV